MIEVTPAPVEVTDFNKVLGRPARVLVTKIGLTIRRGRAVAGFHATRHGGHLCWRPGRLSKR